MHVNSSLCQACIDILHKYQTPQPYLLEWALSFRQQHTEAHISQCGRGRADQEADFAKGASKAHFGESPHNYNAAVDWFRLTLSGGASFDAPWFRGLFATLNDPKLTWGGTFTTLHDLPHIEWRQWREDAQTGLLRLVEESE